MTREQISDIVRDTICGQRTDTHGNPEDSFEDIATMWSIYLGQPINAVDVAILMILLKIVRYMCGKPVLDHMVDAAGYATIAAEIIANMKMDNPAQCYCTKCKNGDLL